MVCPSCGVMVKNIRKHWNCCPVFVKSKYYAFKKKANKVLKKKKPYTRPEIIDEFSLIELEFWEWID